MNTTEWAKNPQTNAPRSITEPAAPANEDVGDSGLTGSVQVVAGLEPVAWRWVWKSARDRAELCYTHTFPANNELMDVESLYSAATVERLVRERDKYKDSVEHYGDLYAKLAAMTKKADDFFDALQLAAKINAEGQAREQQLREALKQVKHRLDCNGISGRQLPEYRQIDAALALPQDDTALNTLLAAGQVREQQLREGKK